jgi:hypothetical protein
MISYCPKHKIRRVYSQYSFALYCPKCVDEVEEKGDEEDDE